MKRSIPESDSSVDCGQICKCVGMTAAPDKGLTGRSVCCVPIARYTDHISLHLEWAHESTPLSSSRCIAKRDGKRVCWFGTSHRFQVSCPSGL